ncbi:hypothetical protein AH2_0003 [Burkholderia phage vB_BceS_AH2]|uniref:Uncharacterized protein n=1 Tax=Burkholderia phage vB_BceS_AH2 TaxID=1133022 RepID=I6NTK2_9CAUD|nr:hypothetical protein B613_gp03 [Burkholderia phage vB_BceS_AH2]AEY69514.1 hypothetical protein AH2_0003 [Burkholderia phage vB_BceS_AH2]
MRASLFLVGAGVALALFGAVITTAGFLAFIIRAARGALGVIMKLFAPIRRAITRRRAARAVDRVFLAIDCARERGTLADPATRDSLGDALRDALTAHEEISRGRP